MNEPSTSSGAISVATVAVCAQPAFLHSITLSPGSAASSIKVYDNAASATGTILNQLLGAANDSGVAITFEAPIRAVNGLTVVVAGTAAIGHITYSLG